MLFGISIYKKELVVAMKTMVRDSLLKIMSALLSLCLLLSMGFSGNATSSDEGVEAGLVGEQSNEDKVYSIEKLNAACRIAEISERYCSGGKISYDELLEIEQLINIYYPNAQTSNYLPGIETNKDDITVLRTDPGASTVVNLNLPGQVQIEDWYCGPASGYAVLKGRGISVSQSTLASQMQTTTNGTGLYYVAPALNLYNGYNGNNFHYATLTGYLLSGANMTAQQWENLFTTTAIVTLLSGYGVIYDCHQVAGSIHYLQGYSNNGNASSSLYHYVAGEGFNSTNPSNKQCYYYDSNNQKTNLGNRHMTISFHDMAILCNDRGLIY